MTADAAMLIDGYGGWGLAIFLAVPLTLVGINLLSGVYRAFRG